MKKIIFVYTLLLSCALRSNAQLSLSTDLGVIRNFSPRQRFAAIGQTVIAEYHRTPKETVYAWILYYLPGTFSNRYEATARYPLTNPPTVEYRIKGSYRLRHFSLGWKHYLNGSFDNAKLNQFYTRAGLGIIFMRIENTMVNDVDVNFYNLQPTPQTGNSEFKKLSLDLGLGMQRRLGRNYSIYGEARTLIRASDNNSPFVHDPRRVPFPFMLHAGLRILFGE